MTLMETRLDRITNDIDTLSTFNETPGTGEGVTRSAFSKEDRMARNYLINEMKKIGLKVYSDGFSTLFGRLEGTRPDAPVIMIGSHYDSVFHGGKFDGDSGCVTALETMRQLVENHVENEYPIELILMNAEEGETFGPSTGVSNSRAMVGTLTMRELETVKNRHGQTKLEALRAYGVTPDLEKAKRAPGSIRNFIELHIEQGPVLENEGKNIGLIDFIPGIGRWKARFYGQTADSTAPMDQRKDALVAASDFILQLRQLMTKLSPGMVGTVGQLNIRPNSNQFVPDFVEAIIEVRTFDTEATNRTNVEAEIQELLNKNEAKFHIRTELEARARINYANPTAPSVMNHENVKKMAALCDQFGYSHMIINNGTGHDSMMMTDFCPTNMIYVPSKDGITHDPREWTDYIYLKQGADILLNLVLDLCRN